MDHEYHLSGAGPAPQSNGGHQANTQDVVMAETYEPQHLDMSPLEVDVSSSSSLSTQAVIGGPSLAGFD